LGHEFSGFTVGGISKALEKLGFSEQLLPELSPGTREALSRAGLFKFHPGAAMDEVLIVLARQRGPEACAAMMEEATRAAVMGVVEPLARMYLTLKGNQPSVLFERFNDLLRSTSRGIKATWTSAGQREGRLQIDYVDRVDPIVVHAWRGAMRHVLVFCRATGEVKVDEPGSDGRSVALLIRWD
jgi:hypothetical protein